ncbi:MAG: hypothetical protein HY852_04565 [Bradyrhizobium sp.]|uniref:hypothetical protein n=1 Tax=Bradyrhizobium sp. TaxID=376 RepID=UPI0025B9A0B8|nr:hypothetical protein [Bradyrhizobium sp.]MBI5261074.1 hypothetical protein [Bradyrhizobium sp.]
MKVSSLSFYNVPVIGWMAKDAVHGSEEAKYFFIFNIAVLFGVLVYAFGYPFVITFALFGTACGLVGLVILTGSDAFAKERPAASVPQARPGRKYQAPQRRAA